MPESLRFCPVCSNRTDFITIAGPPGADMEAIRCGQCGLGIETWLRLDPKAYSSETYDAVRNHGAGGDRWAKFHHDSAVASIRIEQLKDAISGYLPEAVWVDVGCGNGAMPAELRRRGWSVVGVEPDEDTCRSLGNLLGIQALPYASWLAVSTMSPQAATVVSFFDSLEHMLDPVGTLIVASKSVVPGGVIIIELPDLDVGVDDFRNWKHRRISESFTEHIWHFCEGTLFRLVRDRLHDFDILRVSRPVKGRLQAVIKRRLSATPPSGGLDYREEQERMRRDQELEARLQKEFHDNSPLKPITITA